MKCQQRRIWYNDNVSVDMKHTINNVFDLKYSDSRRDSNNISDV